jgi:acyl dehydratase
MAIDPERLLAHRFTEKRQSYSRRDSILYALGIGLGSDPLDERDLDYLLETREKTVPTFAVTLASPGLWVRDPDLGIDWVRLVHAGQEACFEAPLPPEANVVSTARIASIADLGADKGAELVLEREVSDAENGTLYCRICQTLILRGDGGFGGPAPDRRATPVKPERVADVQSSIAISSRAALIYRLSGDWNPIHADPQIARRAGFERPILHGLASYGIAAMAIMRESGADPACLRSLAVRFTGIVHPGDMLDLSIWREPNRILFEAHADGRQVLGRGVAIFGD